jgi:hypothetical protein
MLTAQMTNAELLEQLGTRTRPWRSGKAERDKFAETFALYLLSTCILLQNPHMARVYSLAVE